MHNSLIHTNGAEILDFLLYEERWTEFFFLTMSSILQFQTKLCHKLNRPAELCTHASSTISVPETNTTTEPSTILNAEQWDIDSISLNSKLCYGQIKFTKLSVLHLIFKGNVQMCIHACMHPTPFPNSHTLKHIHYKIFLK